MKKIIIAAVVMSMLSLSVFAQDKPRNGTDAKEGFDKANLFTGGDLILSFSSDGTVVGANPVLGYSFNNWLDAGISLNFIYSAYKDYDYNGYVIDKVHQTNLGPGVFVKVYPTDFLFVQGQYEDNFITQKVIYADGSATQTASVSAPSYLVGLGYSGGREGRRSLFYYISVLVDLGQSVYSPYLDHYSDGSTGITPIIRAGLQVPLFQGKNRRF